jgi:hypothetical protein
MSLTGASLEAATAEVSRIVGRSGHQPDGGTQPEAEESAMAPLVAENDIPAEPREAALWYAKHGIPVFPLYWPVAGGCSCGNSDCKDIGKHPRTVHGFKDATTDDSRINDWFNKWPHANIGIPTGKASGIFVVDNDPRNGGPEDREEFIRLYGPIPETAEVITGSGGRHIYFQDPGVALPTTLGPGVDLKGEGGYVVAPPSLHRSGRRYEFDGTASAKAILNVAPPPDWLMERISAHTNDRTKAEPIAPGEKWPEGNRNNKLASIAGTMRHRGLSREAIQAALLEENRLRCDPPLSEAEVRAIAASVARYEPGANYQHFNGAATEGGGTSENSPGTDNPPREQAGDAGSLITRRIADIEAEPVSWLWEGRLPRGKVTIIAGDPGLGKSQITASVAAVVTTGGQWPVTRDRCEPGDVLFLTAEDDPADTLRPRLEAAGANLQRVHVIDGVIRGYTGNGDRQTRAFSLQEDPRALEAELAKRGNVAVVVIDPISAYLGGVDSHRNAEVRALLAPLGELAARHNVAIIVISRLNKGSAAQAMMRVTGSLAFVAAARAAYLVAADPADKERRLFLSIKINLAKESTGLAFRIEGATASSPAGQLQTSRVMWESEPVTITADEAVQSDATKAKCNAVDEATYWLREILTEGPVPSSEIFDRAEAEGFSKKTVRRAAKKLRIKPAPGGFQGAWSWDLGPELAKDASVAQQKNLGNSEKSGQVWKSAGVSSEAAAVEFAEEEI